MKVALIIILIIAFDAICILLVKGGNRFNGDNREEEVWNDIIERKSH